MIQSLELTLNDAKIVARLDAFRKKRNRLNYERAGAASDREVEEIIALAKALRTAVLAHIKQHHPEYLRRPSQHSKRAGLGRPGSLLRVHGREREDAGKEGLHSSSRSR